MKRNRALFDAVVLVVYLVAANPALTGVPVHEFIGLGAFVVMGVHIVASGDGLAGRGRAGRLALNIVLLVALAACVVSGVMVSGAALPSLGLYATATPSGIRCTPWRPRCCSRPSSCTWSCAPPPPWRCCGNAGVVAPREAIARWTTDPSLSCAPLFFAILCRREIDGVLAMGDAGRRKGAGLWLLEKKRCARIWTVAGLSTIESITRRSSPWRRWTRSHCPSPMWW